MSCKRIVPCTLVPSDSSPDCGEAHYPGPVRSPGEGGGRGTV